MVAGCSSIVDENVINRLQQWVSVSMATFAVSDPRRDGYDRRS
jgi:hypothetical protein